MTENESLSGGTRREPSAPTDNTGGTRREPSAPTDNTGGTRREPSAPTDNTGGTRREPPADAAPPAGTRREANLEDASATMPPAEYGETVLLPSLRGRYQFVTELQGGAEGQVVRAIDTETSKDVLIKQYTRGYDPEVEALERIRQLESRHIVSLFDFGTDQQSSRFYEVQEWIEGPDLQTVLTDRTLKADARTVVEQLATAVADYHQADLIHRDIKPSNLLVASTKPLRLVLIDFGLARTLRGTQRLTSVAGTIEYRAPETIHSSGMLVENRPSLDWWSVGIMAAEVHVGRSFFALPDGSARQEVDIEALVRDRRLEFDKLSEDPGLQKLCRGLLTHDADDRWGGGEVRRWLANPDDPSLTVVKDNESVPVRERTVHFHGAHTEPVPLARAFQENWEEAKLKLFSDPSERLIGDLRAMAREYRLDGVLDLLQMEKSSSPAPLGGTTEASRGSRRLANLLALLDAKLEPVYQGIDLRPHALVEVADPAQAYIQDEIFNNEILLAWRDLPGMERAADIHDRWTDLRTAINQQTPPLEGIDPPTAARNARAQALAIAVDEPQARKLMRKQLKKRQLRKARRWRLFRQLSSRSASSAQLAIATALAPMLALRAANADDGASLPAPISRFEAVGLAAAIMAVFGLILVATGELDDPSVATPALVILAIGLGLVALAREEISKILIGIVGAAGLVLAFSPQVSDSLFYDTATRFAGALIAAPAIALVMQTLWTRWRRKRSRIIVFLAGTITLLAWFGAPLTNSGFVQPVEPDVAGSSELDPAAAAATDEDADDLPTTSIVAAPCTLAQLATRNTEAEWLEAADRIDRLTSPGATAVGPSEWLPGWGPGRFVVFQRFTSSDDAAAFLADLGSAGSGANLIELEAGADACG